MAGKAISVKKSVKNSIVGWFKGSPIKEVIWPTIAYFAAVNVWVWFPSNIQDTWRLGGLALSMVFFAGYLAVFALRSPKPVSRIPANDTSATCPEFSREKFMADWESFLAKREAKERDLEQSYNPDEIESFPVNIWDDFADGDDTYAYVEDRRIPMEVEFKILSHLMQFAETLDLVKNGRVKLRMSFHDSAAKYPFLVGNREAEFCLYSRWELKISCPSHEVLEEFVQQMEKVPDFQSKKVEVYSES